MTRIKKRRSGTKRTSDRKKASAGRRGARAVKKEMIAKEKKDRPGKPGAANEATNKPNSDIKKTGGKTRSAGSRRIAAAKNIATANKKADKKPIAAKKQNEGEERPAKKGFAPWNKNKFKR